MISGLESDQGFGQCKSLISLDIEDAKVTAKGARLAMEHLHKMQFFNCPFTIHVAAQMFKDWRTSSQMLTETGIRQLALMNLHHHGNEDIPYQKGDLEAAIKLCPSVVRVKIARDDTFADEELKSLLNLKNLQQLSLKGTGSVTFENGLLPILRKFGPSKLEKLELQYFPEVNVSAFAQHCANLQSLTLWNIERFISPSRQLKPQDNRLGSLKFLDMMQNNDNEEGEEVHVRQQPPASDILILFSSPALVALLLQAFDGLTDQTMEEAARLYGFPKLQELNMLYCDGITERSIACLLTLDNPLKNICVNFMGPNREKEWKRFESQAKMNNLDLLIELSL